MSVILKLLLKNKKTITPIAFLNAVIDKGKFKVSLNANGETEIFLVVKDDCLLVYKIGKNTKIEAYASMRKLKDFGEVN